MESRSNKKQPRKPKAKLGETAKLDRDVGVIKYDLDIGEFANQITWLNSIGVSRFKCEHFEVEFNGNIQVIKMNQAIAADQKASMEAEGLRLKELHAKTSSNLPGSYSDEDLYGAIKY